VQVHCGGLISSCHHLCHVVGSPYDEEWDKSNLGEAIAELVDIRRRNEIKAGGLYKLNPVVDP
jgi:hypothetical protein